MWYTDRSTDQEQAIAICKGCPVRVDCLGFALSHTAGAHGVWAGYSERKLRRIRKAWKKRDRVGVRGVSPWAVGGLDELASRGLEWGSGHDDEDDTP